MSYDARKALEILPNHNKEIIKDGTMVPVMDVANANADAGMASLLDAVDLGCKEFTGDFYIEMYSRQEPISGLWRHQYERKLACPTPRFDHNVFKYTRSDGKLDYLWTVPEEETCLYLKHNAWLVEKDEQWLLSFVLQYYSGALLKLAKKLNREEDKSVALETGSKLSGAQTVILS